MDPETEAFKMANEMSTGRVNANEYNVGELLRTYVDEGGDAGFMSVPKLDPADKGSVKPTPTPNNNSEQNNPTPSNTPAATTPMPQKVSDSIKANTISNNQGVENALIDGAIAAVSFGTLASVTERAASGMFTNASTTAVGRLLANAPGIVKTAVPALAGAAVSAIANTGLNLLGDWVLGREIDWKQTVVNLGTGLVYGLITRGWDGNGDLPDVNRKVNEPETYIHPVDGDTITVPRGKSLKDVDAETARFYGEAANAIKTGQVREIEDQFIRYADKLGTDDMPSFGEFQRMYNEGGAEWDELTLKVGWKQAVRDGEVQPFTRFSDYKQTADYVRSNAPDLPQRYGGDLDATVRDLLNRTEASGANLADVVEGLRPSGNVDSDMFAGDNGEASTNNDDNNIANKIIKDSVKDGAK